MGLSNIKPLKKEWQEDYRLVFMRGGSGFSFEGSLDAEGRFSMEPLDNEFAKANFLMACEDQAQVTWKHTGPDVQGWKIEITNCGWWLKTPAHGTCTCGEEVWLDHDSGHGIDCSCGRIYNQSGQELAPRSQWEDRWDEDSTQPYCVEFGYIGPGDEY